LSEKNALEIYAIIFNEFICADYSLYKSINAQT